MIKPHVPCVIWVKETWQKGNISKPCDRLMFYGKLSYALCINWPYTADLPAS